MPVALAAMAALPGVPVRAQPAASAVLPRNAIPLTVTNGDDFEFRVPVAGTYYLKVTASGEASQTFPLTYFIGVAFDRRRDRRPSARWPTGRSSRASTTSTPTTTDASSRPRPARGPGRPPGPGAGL